MKKIYLQHELFTFAVRLYPSWVSNGHFLVRRDCIENAHDFSSGGAISGWVNVFGAAEMGSGSDELISLREFNEDVQIERDIFTPYLQLNARTFTVSPYAISVRNSFSNRVDRRRVFQGAEDWRGVAFVDEQYVQALGAQPGELWYGKGPMFPLFNAPSNEGVTIVIMPVEPSYCLPLWEAMNQGHIMHTKTESQHSHQHGGTNEP